MAVGIRDARSPKLDRCVGGDQASDVRPPTGRGAKSDEAVRGHVIDEPAPRAEPAGYSGPLWGSGLDVAIESVVDQFLAEPPVAPAACVALDGPDGRSVVARGVAELATRTPMTGSHAVRIASCTKPFVASTILELAEVDAV